MGMSISLRIPLLVVVGLIAIISKSVYDKVAHVTSIYSPTNRPGVTLVTYSTNFELIQAMRRQGIELDSSNTDYTVRNINGCFYHVVGEPTTERVQLARRFCAL